MNVKEFLDEIALHLNSNQQRTIFGIVGKPGAGKSTLVEVITKRFHQCDVAILSMDGFHLSNEELTELNRIDRKGAPDTFDIFNFAQTLKAVKSDGGDIYFPIFHREIEASVSNEGLIPKSARIVIVEGNYLLSREYGWDTIAQFINKNFFLEIDESVRLERLIARHVKYGKSVEAATAWSLGSDESNARFIAQTSGLADCIISL